jgi:chromosome segregation ATPase
MSDVNQNYSFSVDSQAKVNIDRFELTERNSASEGSVDRFAENSCVKDCFSNDFNQDRVDWSARAHKLRQKNRDFCKKIERLEQAVAESQEQLVSEQERSQNAEIFIARQTEEIGNAQQKNNRLIQELETARQEINNKQMTIESLYAKLAASQEHAARIERECAILQEKYHEQQYKLLETEQQARELSVRLYRQQRYTLQYKTALDQQEENVAAQNQIARQLDQLDSTSFTPKVQPIKTWSLTEEELNYVAELNPKQPVKLEPENFSWQPTNASDTVRELNTDIQAALVPETPLNEEKQYLALSSTKTAKANSFQINKEEKVISSSTNWPSPVIAAAASNRKRKSLAAIELPTFPRYRAY